MLILSLVNNLLYTVVDATHGVSSFYTIPLFHNNVYKEKTFC